MENIDSEVERLLIENAKLKASLKASMTVSMEAPLIPSPKGPKAGDFGESMLKEMHFLGQNFI